MNIRKMPWRYRQLTGQEMTVSFVNIRGFFFFSMCNSPNAAGRWRVWRSPFSRALFGVYAVNWGCTIIFFQSDHSVLETDREGGRKETKNNECVKKHMSKLGSGIPIALLRLKTESNMNRREKLWQSERLPWAKMAALSNKELYIFHHKAKQKK